MYDVIAEEILSIYAEFGLDLDHTNVAFTVTDNGSNMVKAFREYQDVDQESEEGVDTGGPCEDEVEDGITVEITKFYPIQMMTTMFSFLSTSKSYLEPNCKT